MAHFAKLDSNNIVTQVVVVDDKDTKDSNGNEVESIGIAFCQRIIPDGSDWKQTSYNANFRGNYAGIGFTYMTNVETLGVASTDIFVCQQPHASWGMGKTEAQWVSPLPQPELTTTQLAKGYGYVWDEEAHQADSATPKTIGWVLTSVYGDPIL